jgi:hypothetical protein
MIIGNLRGFLHVLFLTKIGVEVLVEILVRSSSTGVPKPSEVW